MVNERGALINPFIVVLVAIPSMALGVGVVLGGLLALAGVNAHWIVTAYPYAVAVVGAVVLFHRSLDPSDHVVGRLAFAALGGAIGALLLVASVHVLFHLLLVVICSGGGCGG